MSLATSKIVTYVWLVVFVADVALLITQMVLRLLALDKSPTEGAKKRADYYDRSLTPSNRPINRSSLPESNPVPNRRDIENPRMEPN
jgi:hypothetical protein